MSEIANDGRWLGIWSVEEFVGFYHTTTHDLVWSDKTEQNPKDYPRFNLTSGRVQPAV